MPLTQFYNGQTITGIDFGNVQNGDTSSAMNSFLGGLTYEDGVLFLLGADEQGTGTNGGLVALSLEGVHALGLGVGEDTTILYSDVTDADFGSAGWKNLSDGKCSVQTPLIISSVSAEEGWNGVLMGAYTGEEPTPPTPEEDDDAYIGYCITPEVVSDKVVKISVPQGGLHAGQVVNCVSLATEVYAVEYNSEVYTATQPTTDTLDSRFFAMVVNGGLEELDDGRRPDGQPNYTKYVYKAGDVCDGVILDKNLVFGIGLGSVGGTKSANPKDDIGKYIVPANGSYTMTISDTATAGGCLKIIGTRYFALGGMFGSEFSRTYVAIAIN